MPSSSHADTSHTTTTKIGFTLLVGLLILAAAGKSILYDTLDPDCFWHLRVAGQLQRDGIGPIVDQLSFTSMKDAWTPYSWLAKLGMKRLWDVGGYHAAVLAQAVMVAWFFTMIALASLEMTRPPRPYLGIALTVVFAAYLALPYLSFRPATMACALLATCMWLILRDRHREHESRAVWAIVPLTALLVNVHLFALFVPLWMAAFALEQRTWRSLLLVALCSLACLATPMLHGGARTLTHYVSSDPIVAAGVIAELVPFYKGSMWWATAALLVLAIGLIAWRGETTGVGEWLCLAIGLVGMLRMGRLAPMFAIVAAPMLASALTMLPGRALRRPVIGGLIGVVLVLGVWQMVKRFPTRDTTLSAWLNRRGPGMPGYPSAAAEFVRNSVTRSSGHVINDFNWGGYIAYELGPRFQVFMDSRTQLYSSEFWQDTCLGDERSMRAILRSTQADAAILPRDEGKIANTLRSLGWKQVFQDDRAQVLLPP